MRKKLVPDINYLPKVVSEFDLHADTTLQDFFPDPKNDSFIYQMSKQSSTLVKQKLIVRILSSLYAGHKKGHKISAQKLSKWIVGMSKLYYLLAKHLLLGPSKQMAASTSFLRGTLFRTSVKYKSHK